MVAKNSLVRLATVALVVALPAAAAAQIYYPSKPVRVVIPWPPGGPNDIVGRIVFQKVSGSLGQPFVVENRAGASGTIGADIFAKSAPDGYSLMVHSATHVSNAHLYRKLQYDTLKDFIGLSPLAVQVVVMVVHPSMPARSVKELITLARARPDQIVYASSGNGSYSHMAMALFSLMTGVKLVHVPYKGAGPATTAVASGETQAYFGAISALLPQIKAQRVRPLAVSSDTRLKQFPDIPTLSEAGVPGYELTSWVACFLPAGTPRPIIDKLSAEIKKALENPDVARTLSSQTLDPWFMTPEEFARRLKTDYDKYEKLIKLTGARIE